MKKEAKSRRFGVLYKTVAVNSLIKDMFAKGHSDEEIASAVFEHKDAEGMQGKEVAELVRKLQKSDEAVAALSALKAADQLATATKAAEEEEAKKLDAKLDEKLKSIGINVTSGRFTEPNELKRFNPITGEIETHRPSEEYKAFNTMLRMTAEKDMKEAKAISDRIDIANDMLDAQVQGLVKATPTVSDVTTRGGFSIPTEVSMQIMQLLYANSVMYQLANKDNVIYQSKVYPLMYGINVGYIADQSTAITEKNPTFINPSVTMQRIGGYSAIANTLIYQKGADLTNAFASAYGSAFAEFLDLHMAVGCVTGNSDLIDGLVFDPNTSLPTPIARSALTLAILDSLKNTLSAKASLAKSVWIANRQVTSSIGLLETTGGQREFPGYVNGGSISPFGIPLVTNPQIPSVLNVGGDVRTGGTDDVLILADMSKVVVGVSQETRIDTSNDILFLEDSMVIRAVKAWGQKVLSSTSTGGIVSIAQELTN